MPSRLVAHGVKYHHHLPWVAVVSRRASTRPKPQRPSDNRGRRRCGYARCVTGYLFDIDPRPVPRLVHRARRSHWRPFNDVEARPSFSLLHTSAKLCFREFTSVAFVGTSVRAMESGLISYSLIDWSGTLQAPQRLQDGFIAHGSSRPTCSQP